MTRHDHQAGATTKDRVVSRFALVALGIPVALTAASVALQLALLPELPDPIATHWNAANEADGFSPTWALPILTALLSLGTPVLLAAIALPGLLRGSRGPSYRLLGAAAAGVSALTAALTTGTAIAQLGLTDANDAPPVTVPLFVALGVAVAVGLAGWALQPAQHVPVSAASTVEPLPLGESERAVWTSETGIAPLGGAIIGVTILLLGATALSAWLFADEVGVAWAPTGIAVLVALLAGSTLVFRVRVDEAGLTVRSVFGLPRFQIPLAEIAEVREESVDPMSEFGGWGMRWAPGRRFGVVLRRGPAIEVERVDGRRFVVTAPDAATGAALLQALAERNRATLS